jgi:hypothetical protein
MMTSSSFTLHREPSASRGALLHEGRDTGFHLEAAVLEAQFQVEPGLWLLFFTDDSPYEEALRIVLLDSHFRLLDGLALGLPYTPGLLSGLQPEGAHRMAFEFFAGTRMVLTVHPLGVVHVVRRLPSFARPLTRRLLSKHYLSVESVQAQRTGVEAP